MSQVEVDLQWNIGRIMDGVDIEEYEIRGTTLFANIPQTDLENRVAAYDHQEELNKRDQKRRKRDRVKGRVRDGTFTNADIGYVLREHFGIN